MRLPYSGVHHLQGPQQNLAEMTDQRKSVFGTVAHESKSLLIPVRVVGIPGGGRLRGAMIRVASRETRVFR